MGAWELLSGSNKLLADQIIRAAKTDVYRHVFFLGPYARRVSFSSQQNRALNLVWALQGLDYIEKGDKIAVIGAGLSGITACAALVDLGYTVTLYEAGQDVMNRQVSADHRYIHPSVNWWPDRPIVETTIVPYFDWVSARCTKLIGAMRAEWAELKDTEGLTFIHNVQVMGFSEARTGQRVGVITSQQSPAAGERYHAVIVTSGFSDENYGDRASFPGYWDPDRLEWRVDQPEEGGMEPRFLVSGCGDGGLIDALRIVHRSFRRGELIVDVARQLPIDWEGAKIIREAEHDLARDDTRLRDAIRDGSEKLENAYVAALGLIPPDVRATLDESLRSDRACDFVTLLSREKTPYSPMSAPIHKLLITHAMEALLVSHRCCLVVGYSTREVRVAACGTDPADIATAPTETLRGHVILRHGAPPNFRKFLSDDAAADALIERQKLLAPDLDYELWRTGNEPLKEWPPAVGFARELERRRKQAALLISRIAGMASGTLHLDEIHGFLFEHRGDAGSPASTQLPEKIFGFPLRAHRANELTPTETQACGSAAPSWEPPSGALVPGLPILSALNGRLGPIFRDARGKILSVSVAHLAPSSGHLALAVLDESDRAIGHFLQTDEAAVHAHRDIGLIELDQTLAISPAYGDQQAITSVVQATQIFGQEVSLQRPDGRTSVGYVSSTWAPVVFRHPGSQKLIVVRDAVRIRSRDPSSLFAQTGDSGAPVIDLEGRLLGLVLSNDDVFTYVVPIGEVINDLGLTPLETPLPGLPVGGTDESPLDDLLASNLKLFAAANRRDQQESLIDLGSDYLEGEHPR